MTPDKLIALRRADWEQLTALTRRVGRGRLSTMSEDELSELGRLYRATTSDLALAQRDFPQHDVTVYLNQLVGRAHPLVYRGQPAVWRNLTQFFTRDLPQLYRAKLSFVIASTLLFVLPAIAYYAAIQFDRDLARLFLPPDVIFDARDGAQWWRDLNDANTVGASVIATNNLRVSIFAFAGGMTFGLLTIYVLVTNGLLFGGVFGILNAYGNAGPLAEFVIGHGVLELTQIFIAGACGLMIGWAMLRPGLLSRRNALQVAALDSLKLLLGTLPLLVIAGLIEGYLSPSYAPIWIKVGVGIGLGVAVQAYLLLAGQPSLDPSLQAGGAPESQINDRALISR
jgi:uncharacterized membrane protein SpoIIM required for sporulation